MVWIQSSTDEISFPPCFILLHLSPDPQPPLASLSQRRRLCSLAAKGCLLIVIADGGNTFSPCGKQKTSNSFWHAVPEQCALPYLQWCIVPKSRWCGRTRRHIPDACEFSTWPLCTIERGKAFLEGMKFTHVLRHNECVHVCSFLNSPQEKAWHKFMERCAFAASILTQPLLVRKSNALFGGTLFL